MNLRLPLFLSLWAAFIPSFAASGATLLPGGHTLLPVVTQPFSPVTASPGGAATTITLSSYFNIDGVSNQIVQFGTGLGTFNIELQPTYAPKTVTNFLSYVNSGAYTDSLIHRVVASFVIQGGGYTLAGSQINTIPTNAPVVNEFNLSNVVGTVAMAKIGSDPNSATDQWFVNLVDNSASLDTTNSGYTVFARVIGTGMTVVQQIGALMTVDASSSLGAAFSQLPVVNYTSGASLMVSNLVLANSIGVVPIYPTAGSPASVLNFSITSNSNPSLVTPSISASSLVLNYAAGQTGSAAIVVRATDTNGNFIENTLNVTVAGSTIVSGNGFSPSNYQNIAFNGLFYDQVLLTGQTVTVNAKTGHFTRTSFIDENNNIVQAEFSGSGTLTITLDNNNPPAPPVNYTQAINYVKGRATFVITGAGADTYFSFFSAGIANTDPSIIKSGVTYDAIATGQSLTVNGSAMAGLNAADARFIGSAGTVGIAAPSIAVSVYCYVGNINASGTGAPTLTFGSVNNVFITGGNMLQTNGAGIVTSGISHVIMSTGTTSANVTLPKAVNKGKYLQNGVDVTSTLVTP